MKYYIDITLLPDAETNLAFLWQKVYQQLHLALVETKKSENRSEIAVSFPLYGDKVFPLGNKLRLLASTQTQLQKLDINKWLSRLMDYTHCTSIKEVPEGVDEFVSFKRKQCDTNVERIARRRVKRHGESFDRALEHLSGFKDKETGLPFLNMNSLSGSRRFKLFIEKEIKEEPQSGYFTCYGLSRRELGKNATVPWF